MIHFVISEAELEDLKEHGIESGSFVTYKEIPEISTVRDMLEVCFVIAAASVIGIAVIVIVVGACR